MENKPQNARNTQRTEIDLLEVGGVLLHWLWLIVAVALAFGIVGFCVSKFVLPEQFQSTTKVYVLNRSEENRGESPTYSDLQAGSQLTKDYAEMITSRYVLEKVIHDLELPYAYETLKSKVLVTTQTDTRIIQIIVTDEQPVMAEKLARKVRVEASKHIQNVMEVDAINVVDDANLPEHKSAPNNRKNAMTAALLGALLVCAFVIIRYLLDDTIKTREDVEKYLNVSCLAIIPLDEAVSQSDPDQKRKKRKKKKKKKHRPRSFTVRINRRSR